MRHYSEALSQLVPDALIVKWWKHSFFDASLSAVFDGYLGKIGELNEIVIVTTFFNLLSHDSPLGHAGSELETRKLDLFQLDAPSELLERTRYNSLILDGIKRASRVGDLAPHFKQLETLEKNAWLQYMQGRTVLSRPFLPFLRDFSDCRIWTARHITHNTIKEDSCISWWSRMLGEIAERREVLSIVIQDNHI